MTESSRTVGRVVRVLELVAESQGPVRLTEFAKSLDIPVSSAHLLLDGLAKEGILRRVNGRGFESAPRLAALAVRVAKRLTVVEIARPTMIELMEQTQQDVYLAVPCEIGMMYVERVNGPTSLRLDIPMGIPRAMHATAIGQLYLANLDLAAAKSLIENLDLVPLTPHTITSKKALLAKVDKIRATGLAQTNEESVDGIVALAGPIYSGDGSLAGALSISMFASLAKRKSAQFAELLVTACAEISNRMGWRGGPEGRRDGAMVEGIR